MKYLQTRLEVKNMNINYYESYYTVLKNRGEKVFEIISMKMNILKMKILLYLIKNVVKQH